MSEAERLAQDHIDWFIPFITKVYHDAFIHGYKHGRFDERVKPVD